jgi:hypothetical protein
MKFITFLLIALVSTNLSYGQWTADLRLTNDAGSSQLTGSFARDIAASGDSLYVVWFDNRDGNNEIYFKRSVDNGASWGADTRLTTDAAGSNLPAIAVSGQDIHVAWSDARDGNFEIYYKHSADAGVTWSSDTRLTNDAAISSQPCLALSGANVYMAFRDSRDGNQEIYFKRSVDNGVTWSTDARLTNNSEQSFGANLVADGQYLAMVWLDSRDGNAEIYFRKSLDGGTSWGSEIRLTNDINASQTPSVAISGSDLHVTWNDNRDGNFEIYYKHSADGGATWGADTRLTNDQALSGGVTVLSSGSIVHVIFHDARPGNTDIYYKRSTDAGATWSGDMRLTADPATSFNPSVALSGTGLQVIWIDLRDGNFEIYYKKDPTANSLPNVNAGNDGTIYLGYGCQSTVLTAIAGGGRPPYSYLWSNSATTPSITVSPTTTTTYTVVVTDALNITDTDNVVVTVNDVRCGNGNDKVLVCHNGHSNCVSPNAVPAHLNHGDQLGNCSNNSRMLSPGNEIKETVLYPNYPNPFSAVTIIKFQLLNDGPVTLRVFDVTGREVASPLNTVLLSGTHEVAWNATGYAPGAYYYTLVSGDFRETKKMILVR